MGSAIKGCTKQQNDFQTDLRQKGGGSSTANDEYLMSEADTYRQSQRDKKKQPKDAAKGLDAAQGLKSMMMKE